MDWLKRNLVLVAVGVVALGLLGFGGYSLYAKYQQDAEITGALQGEMDVYNSLQQKNPYPNEENIQTAQADQKRVDEFLAASRRAFAPVTEPEGLDNASFRNLLDNTISDLRRDAEKYGVSLDAFGGKYGFTFQAQLNLVQYDPKSLGPLAIQLAEIRAITEVLYRANVHSLLGIRRVAVSTNEETFGSVDYLVGKRITTDPDTGAIITPYEVTFQGFSSELAAVLEGLGGSPHCFVVKNVVVDKSLSPLMMAEGEGGGAPPGMDANLAARYGLATAGVPAAPPGMDPTLAARYGLNRPGGPGARYGGKQDGPGGGMDAAMRSRYGLGPRNPYGGAPGAGQAPGVPMAPVGAFPPVATITPAPPRTGLSTVLDERPLRVTLQIESIRFPSAAELQRQKPAPPKDGLPQESQ